MARRAVQKNTVKARPGGLEEGINCDGPTFGAARKREDIRTALGAEAVMDHLWLRRASKVASRWEDVHQTCGLSAI